MSSISQSYIGDIGTRIRTTLNSDLTGYSTVKYKIIKPNGDILTTDCIIEDEVVGIIYYDVISGDFNQIGIYYVQVELVFSNGNRFLSYTKNFEIHQEWK